jgi:hypothetical protein
MDYIYMGVIQAWLATGQSFLNKWMKQEKEYTRGAGIQLKEVLWGRPIQHEKQGQDAKTSDDSPNTCYWDEFRVYTPKFVCKFGFRYLHCLDTQQSSNK